MNETVERKESSKVQIQKRLDRLAFAMVLLTSQLRSTVKTENGELIASVPVSVLDQIERMVLTQGDSENGKTKL